MAQPTLSHPQGSTRIDTPASSNHVGSSTAPSVSYEHERASKMANDLRVAYSHVTAPEAGPSPHYTGTRSISMIA
jgi:hypothetical protein